MRIFKNLIERMEKAVLDNPEQIEEFVKVTAVAAYIDRKVYDSEVETSKRIITEQLESLGVSDKQVEVALEDFEAKLEAYQEDIQELHKDRKWLKELISDMASKKNSKQSLLINIVKEIFEADDFIGEEEYGLMTDLKNRKEN